jgi:arylsulfatase A-like enzyme
MTVLYGCVDVENRKIVNPNIILILTDDQGWTDTSVPMMDDREDSKSDFYQTPNLEKMAKEGMRFSNAYASAPVCLPTRHSIQFGKTPARLRSTTLSRITGDCAGEVSLAQMIKTANPEYVTAHFGKNHMKRSPEDLGYDMSDGDTENFEGDFVSREDKRILPEDDPKRIFSLTERANKFIEEQVKNNKPFFMQLSHYAAHVQHMALKSTKDKYLKLPRGKKCTDEDYETPPPKWNSWIIEYAAMIEDVDTGIGMVLDKLEQLGINNKTYVIFISDNGGGFRDNEPLRGGKANLWEGGIRVPMVVTGPGIKAGSLCNTPVAAWDIYPTISELIGNRSPLPEGLDGGSLVSLFEKGDQGEIKRKTEGLIFHFPWYWTPQSAIRLGDFKLLKDLDSEELYLFDITKDIEEKNNLASSMPEKAGELHKKLIDYLKEVDAEKTQVIRETYYQDLLKQKKKLELEIKECIRNPELVKTKPKKMMWMGDGFSNLDVLTYNKRRIKQIDTALNRLGERMK